MYFVFVCQGQYNIICVCVCVCVCEMCVFKLSGYYDVHFVFVCQGECVCVCVCVCVYIIMCVFKQATPTQSFSISISLFRLSRNSQYWHNKS